MELKKNFLDYKKQGIVMYSLSKYQNKEVSLVTFTQFACGTKSTTTEMSCKKETPVTGEETTCYCNTSKCNNSVDRAVVNKATILVLTILALVSFDC